MENITMKKKGQASSQETQGLKIKVLKDAHLCIVKVRPLIGSVEEDKAGKYSICKPYGNLLSLAAVELVFKSSNVPLSLEEKKTWLPESSTETFCFLVSLMTLLTHILERKRLDCSTDSNMANATLPNSKRYIIKVRALKAQIQINTYKKINKTPATVMSQTLLKELILPNKYGQSECLHCCCHYYDLV